MVAYWEPGTQYNYGSIVEYEGHKYKIIQPHFSEGDWTPPATPALWGRIQDEDDVPQPPSVEQHQQQQQQQQQPYTYSGQQQYGGDHNDNPYEKHPDQQADIPQEERKKNWWDLDDERKKQLEVGGGLLAGAALLAGGYAAYHHHEKTEEQKKATAWGLQGWLKEAQDRTNLYRRNGPQGPTTWVLVQGKDIPPGALVGGQEHGQPLYIARAFIDGGLQVGKASQRFSKGGVFGFRHKEIELPTYEVLLGDPRAVRWIPAHKTLSVQNLEGLRPVEGGREDDGTPLFIAQADAHGGVHPGKCSEKLGGAYISYGGTEEEQKNYRVLCYV
ncbi:hypothetical protein EWM64_g2391 [Hericium alpestre]|uniref:Chitin-binding type-3 domain-containing protein n=1 Tax=Hericium alpestre TaxID=135208 RepID=A0A4Z0A3N0_9AGAM|nr:hypothetical protein EWM64_g2391 [Hericium alpestre]